MPALPKFYQPLSFVSSTSIWKKPGPLLALPLYWAVGIGLYHVWQTSIWWQGVLQMKQTLGSWHMPIKWPGWPQLKQMAPMNLGPTLLAAASTWSICFPTWVLPELLSYTAAAADFCCEFLLDQHIHFLVVQWTKQTMQVDVKVNYASMARLQTTLIHHSETPKLKSDYNIGVIS